MSSWRPIGNGDPLGNMHSWQISSLKKLRHTCENLLSSHCYDSAQYSDILTASKVAALSTSFLPEEGIPDASAALGDLRERLISLFRISSRARVFLALFSTNLGELQESFSSYESRRLVRQELRQMSQSSGDWMPSIYGKYLLLHYVDSSPSEYAERQSDAGARFVHGSVGWHDVSAARSIAAASNSLVSVVHAAHTIEKGSKVRFRYACKAVELSCGLSNIDEASLSASVVSRDLDYVLERLYYELAVAVKADSRSSDRFGTLGGNTSELVAHFDTVSSLVHDGQKSAQISREYLARVLNAVTITSQPDQKLYSQLLAESLINRFFTSNRSDMPGMNTRARWTLQTISERLNQDHKFAGIGNEWQFARLLQHFDRLGGTYYSIADVHDIERGVLLLDQENNPIQANGQYVRRSRGYWGPMLDLVDAFLAGRMSAECLLERAYETRCKREGVLAEYFRALGRSKLRVDDEWIYCFHATAGDGVEGFVRTPSQAVRAMVRAEHASRGEMSGGVGLARVIPGISYLELHNRGEFALHVTKLFKGTGTSWECIQVWGQAFGSAQAERVLALMAKKIESATYSPSDQKFLRKVLSYEDMWACHLPRNARSRFAQIMESISQHSTSMAWRTL